MSKPSNSLTPRERNIAECYADGQTHKAVAQTLNLSPATVRNYISRIYAKLHINNKAELIKHLHATLPRDARGAPVSPPGPVAALAPEERRLVTVLVARLCRQPADDLEQLFHRSQRFQAFVEGIISRYHGHVARYDSNLVLAYFGYPKALENGAEHALRASLEIAGYSSDLDAATADSLPVSVGIASGMAVFAADPHGRHSLFGTVSEHAQQLARQGGPGKVMVAASSRQLAGEGFLYAPRQGPARAGGGSDPPAWRLEGIKSLLRFASRLPNLGPLVGRDAEIRCLLDHWVSAQQGAGQAIVVLGESGLGKSRLLHALLENIDERFCQVQRYQCSPFYAQTALHPFIAHFNARFEPGTSIAVKLEQLSAWLSASRNPTTLSMPLLAELLAVPVTDRRLLQQLEPAQRKQEVLALLSELTLAEAEQQPLLLLLEDAHWLDATSFELVYRLIVQSRALPVLIIITTRERIALPDDIAAAVTEMTLARLDDEQARLIVDGLTGSRALAPALCEQIIRKTDGVPLFIEEVTKAVLEHLAGPDGAVRASQNRRPAQHLVPATLYDSLLARLDRLGPAKEISQVASVIGREFNYDLLDKAFFGDQQVLRNGLDRLINAGLVFLRSKPPNARYVFKHALIRDVAYETLLPSRRRALHAKIARALEQQEPETSPELLARHYTEAALITPAVQYWQRAGEQAICHAAYDDAVKHLCNGLRLLEKLPENREPELELDLLIALGEAYVYSQGTAARVVKEVYTRAQALCDRVNDRRHIGTILNGLRTFHMTRGNTPKSLELSRELLRFAAKQQKPELLILAYKSLGLSLFFSSEFSAAKAALEESVDRFYRYRTSQNREALLFEYETGVISLSFLALTLWLLGYPQRALDASDKALSLARSTTYFSTHAVALSWRGILFQLRRQPDKTLETTREQFRISQQYGLSQWQIAAMIREGWARAELGEHRAGLELIRDGLTRQVEKSGLVMLPYNLGLLAEVYAKQQTADCALTSLDNALALAEEMRLPFWNAELHRLQGQLYADGAGSGTAEACYQKAIKTARAQGAKTLELRAATSLAGLWLRERKRAAAHAVLDSVYRGFSEGFDTPDLQDAETLLGELSN